MANTSVNRSHEARRAIMESIRTNLAASVGIVHAEHAIVPDRGELKFEAESLSPVERFRERLESVGGYCVVVQGDDDAARALAAIVDELRERNGARRIALSDAADVTRLARNIAADEIKVCPSPADLFNFDAGITSAQAAIADTGTLVLEAETERHRLVSLLPPVHIAVVYARNIVLTIGDALRQLHGDDPRQMSRAITFITGPSRTADIELTLTVGVHGPKELHVIVIEEAGGVAPPESQ
jgi:L-lactate dehydrogenase complex protein LldG